MLTHLEQRAKVWWKEHLPEMYQELDEAGLLHSELRKSSLAVNEAMDSLEERYPEGVPDDYRRAVYRTHLFLKPMEEPKEEPIKDEVHEMHKIVVEMEEALLKIEEEEDRER